MKVWCNLILKKPHIVTEYALKYTCSKCRLVNQVYTLLAWAFKPYLSYTSCKKGRAGGAASGEMGGKKGKSSKRGSTGASGVVAAFT